jgi:hypothetical protein
VSPALNLRAFHTYLSALPEGSRPSPVNCGSGHPFDHLPRAFPEAFQWGGAPDHQRVVMPHAKRPSRAVFHAAVCAHFGLSDETMRAVFCDDHADGPYYADPRSSAAFLAALEALL